MPPARPYAADGFALVGASGMISDGGSFFEALPVLPTSGEVTPSDEGMHHLDPEVFNWRDYLARYPDLRDAGLTNEQDAIIHWLTFGIAEHRQGGPDFSVDAYLAANPDVQAATQGDALTAIAHFVMYGRAEGRSRGDLAAKPTQIGSQVGIPASGLSAGNDVVQISVSARTGGAIDSLAHGGREYLNDFDHGRQLQVAWQMNHGGEGNNPTEGGSSNDGVGATTSSNVLAATATATGLSITSQPAWWLQAGDNVPATNAAATNGGSGSLVSSQVLTKSVEVGVTIGGVYYPNILRHDASVTFPEGAAFVGMEMPTAYLQGDFDRHHVYDIDSASLKPQEPINSNPDASGHIATAYSQDANGPRHRPNPIVFATADGQHAMALVPALPLPPGFDDQLLGRMSFPNDDPAHATQKMTALLTASNVPPGATLGATTYVVVGTIEEVRRSLEALYAAAPV